MAKFGALPIGEATSFGVANVLRGEGKVYFESVFSSRHVGRVSDLLSAELRQGPDEELRFRIALVAGVFESIRKIGRDSSGPVLIECGVDAEKVALAVSFECETPDAESEGSSWLKRFVSDVGGPMARLQEIADALIVRGETVDGTRRKVEIVSLFARPEARARIEEGDFRRVHLLCLDGVAREEAKDAKEYVALSRLDFPKLLAPEPKFERVARSAPKRLRAEAEASEEGLTRISADEHVDEEVITIRATPAEEPRRTS